MEAALLRCIADLAPDLGAEARTEIAQRLHPLAASAWPEVAWRFSRLTGDGFPVEFAFSSRDDALRLTLEPRPPEAEGGGGVGRNGRALRWGTWLGLRQSGNGVRVKHYLEACAMDDSSPQVQEPLWVAPRRRMTGVDPDGGLEHYYDLADATPMQVELLLSHWGFDVQTRLRPQLEVIWGRPLEAGLKFVGLGASRSVDQNGRNVACALFFRAAAVPGSAERVRRAILSGQDAQGLPHAAYRRLWGHVPAAELPDHGVVSLIDAPPRPVEVRCGISGRAVLQAYAARVG